MQGLTFTDFGDKYNRWNLDTVLSVVSKVKLYCDNHHIYNADLVSVEHEQDCDRFNIRIRYGNEKGLVEQILLIINGEIMDGEEFHRRRSKNEDARIYSAIK